jgi:hypothetical protein
VGHARPVRLHVVRRLKSLGSALSADRVSLCIHVGDETRRHGLNTTGHP